MQDNHQSQHNDTRVKFHPDFPNYWQVKTREPIRIYSHLPSFSGSGGAAPDTEQPHHQAAGGTSDTTSSDKRLLLFPNQVVRAKIWDAHWIRQYHNGGGSFVPRSGVQPYFPVFRVVANDGSNDDDAAGGVVAPYVVSTPSQLPKFYNVNSPLRRPDLAQPIGHVFDDTPAAIQQQQRRQQHDKNWWTSDGGETWWPQTVRNKIPCTTNMYFPTWIPNLGKRVVTEWAPPVESSFIRTSLGQGNNMAWLVAVMVVEYLMIICGALAGIEYGWSIRLQLVYVVMLVGLVAWEIGLVVWLIPNGRVWVKMNAGKLVGSVFQGVLWRWDLYGDVGFCILAYQERDRILAQFWIVPTALTTLVIGGRLAACFYYLCKARPMDEKTLAKFTVPSFLTVFGLLCESLLLGDTKLALSSARTQFRFEAYRTIVEDFPEIVLQAVYLFGPQAPPTCPECAYGFVMVSLFASIATSCPGVFRLYNAFSRFTMFRSEVRMEDNQGGKDKTTKRYTQETTARLDESTRNDC